MFPANRTAPHLPQAACQQIFKITTLNPNYVIALLSISSMVSLFHIVGRVQINMDRLKQKRFILGSALFIIGSLILLCLMLQKPKNTTKVKECESLYEKILEMLEMLLSFKRLDSMLSALIGILLAWALFLLALCERNTRRFLASCKKLLSIRV